MRGCVIRSFPQVRRLKPGWPKGFYREGVALLAAGRPAEAGLDEGILSFCLPHSRLY